MKTQNANTLEDKKDRFTPGEWKVDVESNNQIWICVENNVIAEVCCDDYGKHGNEDIRPSDEQKANAEHIVKCTNSHFALVSALQNLVDRDLIRDRDGDHYDEILELLEQVK